MIINKIHKVKISAGFVNYYRGHELEIWFDDRDLTKRGYIYNINVERLKEKGIVKRGYSFKNSEQYYNSEEGKEWLKDYINSKNNIDRKEK